MQSARAPGARLHARLGGDAPSTGAALPFIVHRAVDRLQACSERAPLHINLVIYTELLVPEPEVAVLDAMLDVFETQRSALPWYSAALAAKAFSLYRKRGGVRRSPRSDFYIGAHAAASNLTVLTRDRTPYRSHFPRLMLVCPD